MTLFAAQARARCSGGQRAPYQRSSGRPPRPRHRRHRSLPSGKKNRVDPLPPPALLRATIPSPPAVGGGDPPAPRAGDQPPGPLRQHPAQRALRESTGVAPAGELGSPRRPGGNQLSGSFGDSLIVPFSKHNSTADGHSSGFESFYKPHNSSPAAIVTQEATAAGKEPPTKRVV